MRPKGFLSDFDVLFNDFFYGSEFKPILHKDTGYPIDIYVEEKSGELVFEIALVGAKREDIEIGIKDSVLCVNYKGKKNNDSKTEFKRDYISRGISDSEFKYEWKISDNFDLKQSKVSLDSGLLKIVVPKSKNSGYRILDIE